MELYFAPGACSRAAHIVLRELGRPFTLVKVDLRAKTFGDGRDYRAVNSKGQVPALRLDGGELLTENAAVLQWLADSKPEAQLAPPAGTLERVRLQEWLSFIGAELHKSLGAFFRPNMPEETRKAGLDRVAQWLGWVDKQLAGRPHLMGHTFTVADAYAFVILSWTGHFSIDLTPYPNVQAYLARISARESVKQAIAAETA